MSGLPKAIPAPMLLVCFQRYQRNSLQAQHTTPSRKEEVGVAIQQWEYIIVDVRLWRSGEAVYVNGHPIERLAHSSGRAAEYEDGQVPSLYEVLEWLGKNGWEMTGIAPDEHYSK